MLVLRAVISRSAGRERPLIRGRDTVLGTHRLTGRPGREAEAEPAIRAFAAAAIDPYALPELAEWLTGRPGREAEAEQADRDAAAANAPTHKSTWPSG
jgi:hypothetical protein